MKKIIYIFIFLLPIILFSCSESDAEFITKADAPDVITLDLLLKEVSERSDGLYGYKLKLTGKISKIDFLTIEKKGPHGNNHYDEPGFQIGDDDDIYLKCILRTPSDVANLKANQEIIFEGWIISHDTNFSLSTGKDEILNFGFDRCKVLDIRD